MFYHLIMRIIISKANFHFVLERIALNSYVIYQFSLKSISESATGLKELRN